MKNTLACFEYGRFYHVFNRTNNQENLFPKDENKHYFLSLIKLKLGGYINFYAYALLENHFHFAISICSEEEIIRQIKSIPIENRKKQKLLFLK